LERESAESAKQKNDIRIVRILRNLTFLSANFYRTGMECRGKGIRNAALKYRERKLGFFEKKIQAIKKKIQVVKKMDKEKPLGGLSTKRI